MPLSLTCILAFLDRLFLFAFRLRTHTLSSWCLCMLLDWRICMQVLLRLPVIRSCDSLSLARIKVRLHGTEVMHLHRNNWTINTYQFMFTNRLFLLLLQKSTSANITSAIHLYYFSRTNKAGCLIDKTF